MLPEFELRNGWLLAPVLAALLSAWPLAAQGDSELPAEYLPSRHPAWSDVEWSARAKLRTFLGSDPPGGKSLGGCSGRIATSAAKLT